MQDVYYEDDSAGGIPRSLAGWVQACVKWGGAAVSLALVAAIVVWAYKLGIRDARDIPVLKALDSPVRVRPDNPGGTEIAHQGLEVNGILAGGEAATPAETVLAPASAPLTDEDVPLAQLEPVTAETEVRLPPADPAAAAPAADDAAEAEVTLEELLQQALEPDGDALPRSAPPRPRLRPAGLRAPAAAIIPAATVDAGPVTAAGSPGAQQLAGTPGARLVQLGAFDSESAADEQWRRYVAAHGDLLGNRDRAIQRAESNGRVFYRLRVVGFADDNDQSALCEALRARQVACIPVTVR